MAHFPKHWVLFGIREHADNVDEIIRQWKEYKQMVPTYGAIILNENLSKVERGQIAPVASRNTFLPSLQVLLVRGFSSRSSWGFPKGKVNEDEAAHVCATREVLEETGFDITERLDPDHFLEATIQGQRVRHFLIPGAPEAYSFGPKTRGEIKDITWVFSVLMHNRNLEVLLLSSYTVYLADGLYSTICPATRRRLSR